MWESELMGTTILLVDDNDDILDGYAEMLRQGGYEVLTATNGTTALELAFRTAPAAIVIDLWMPGMDGFDVMRALRGDPRTSDTPILAFSSLGFSEQKAELAGSNAFLRKTVPADQFLATLRKLIAASRERHPAG
jgi:CheY-like chemotaxis protein